MNGEWSAAKRTRAGCVFVLVVFAAASALAQQSAAATGSVVGYVDDDETKLPMRFAIIQLLPKPANQPSGLVEDQPETNPPKPRLSIVRGVTGIDGSFRLDGVPAGDYFAGAQLPGYVMLGTFADASASEEQLKQLIANLPTVRVTTGRVATVNLGLSRGGVITGRVLYADGGPAVGATVAWEHVERNLAVQSVRMARPSPAQEILYSFEFHDRNYDRAVSDDEGRYRIYGLLPGKYIVTTPLLSQTPAAAQVMMTDGSSPASTRRALYPEVTTVYAPGVFRRNEAKVYEVRGNEQITNADVILDTSGLHTVRGRVLAGEDHHVPSNAMVRIRDDGGNVGKFVTIEDDGFFQLHDLMPGKYRLEVSAIDEEKSGGGNSSVQRVSRRYQLGRLTFVVAGHDVVLDDVLLKALKPGEREMDPE